MTTTATTIVIPQQFAVRYDPRGAARDLFLSHDRELVLDGPAGTGKSFAMLQKVHLALTKYPGARALLARKTLRSLAASTLVTYQRKVLHGGEGVKYFGGSAREPAQFRYPNGSVLIIGGLDKAEKVMSTEYDLIAVDEATELEIDDWESLLTRLRNGMLPYQQLIGCCNPQGPHHWLNQRLAAGLATRLTSRHEDNPTVTPAYLAILDALTGVRHLRLRLGVWAAADGMVYEDAWDAARNLVKRPTVTGGRLDLDGDCGVPRDWPRYWAIDWGYTAPFVCRMYARDPDGRLWMYREFYMSRRTVPEHCRDILRRCLWKQEGGRGRPVPLAAHADVLPREVLYDPADPQAAQLFMQHTGLYLTPAPKDIANGIQAVRQRFQPAGDGLPRLAYLRDSLVERDVVLADAKKPTSGVEEVESYVWDTRGGQKRGEQPVDENNHAMDCDRYLCTHLDVVPTHVGVQRFSY